MVLVGGAQDTWEVSRQVEGKKGWRSRSCTERRSSSVLLGRSDPPCGTVLFLQAQFEIYEVNGIFVNVGLKSPRLVLKQADVA